jgi:hypothetical protein
MKYSKIIFTLLLAVILYACVREEKQSVQKKEGKSEKHMILAYDNDTIVVH